MTQQEQKSALYFEEIVHTGSSPDWYYGSQQLNGTLPTINSKVEEAIETKKEPEYIKISDKLEIRFNEHADKRYIAPHNAVDFRISVNGEIRELSLYLDSHSKSMETQEENFKNSGFNFALEEESEVLYREILDILKTHDINSFESSNSLKEAILNSETLGEEKEPLAELAYIIRWGYIKHASGGFYVDSDGDLEAIELSRDAYPGGFALGSRSAGSSPE